MNAPRSAAEMFTAILQYEPIEVFGILCLTTRARLIGYREISRGTIDSTIVSPRDVFQAALLAHAPGIVLGHNHPSGDPTPSPDDRALTLRLVSAGALMGVDVFDHVIVGAGRYFSFKEAGEL